MKNLDNLFDSHKMVKETVGMYTGRSNEILKEVDGLIVLDTEDRVGKWKDYIQFFHNNGQRGDLKKRTVDIGPIITTREVTNAINKMNNYQAFEPEQVWGSPLKLTREDLLDILANLSIIYMKRPSEWLLTMFLHNPKNHYLKSAMNIHIISFELELLLKIM